MAGDEEIMTSGDDPSDELVPAWTTAGHLDEGTIHAWLDGAFDDAQAAVVEAHVDGCSRCRESVAEARGFIAGASRMVRALDAVPSGVVPQADVERAASRIVAAASAGRPAVSADHTLVARDRARARPAWYMRTPVRAAAALLVMVAGGTYVLSRNPVTALTESDRPAIDSVAPALSPAPALVSSSAVAAGKTAQQPIIAPPRERRATPSAAPQAVAPASPAPAPSILSDAAVANDLPRGKIMKEEPAQASALVAARSAEATAPSKAAEGARSDRAAVTSCWSLRADSAGASVRFPNGLADQDFRAGASVPVTWIDWPEAGRATRVEFTLDPRGTLSAVGASDGKELSLSLTRSGDGWTGTAAMRDAAEFGGRTSARPVTQQVTMTRAALSVCKR